MTANNQVAEASVKYLAEVAEKTVPAGYSCPSGYKQTEVGIIPEDWSVQLGMDVFAKIQDGTHFSPKVAGGEFLYVTSKNIKKGYLDLTSAEFVDRQQHEAIYRRCDVREGDILLTKDGANTGNAAINTIKEQFSLLSSVAFLRVNSRSHSSQFFLQQILSSDFQAYIQEEMSGNAITRLTLQKINNLKFYVPPKEEQTAIANALSDVDALIHSLEKLIAKKQAIKTAAMQQLLTGRTRLPQFALREEGTSKGYKQSELGEIPEDWEVIMLGNATKCLDNVRVPLNESQRSKMRGDIPYCGANGVVGWVNEYVIDDDIILMAEDGGYFDEFATRPIAYRMIGKCWINNHAHVLQALDGFDQGYIFYSLVHKDIQKYLASGTRAKLNKAEMEKIEIVASVSKEEQTAIATILSDMDAEIQALQQRLSKTRHIKQGMMQELLTGRMRLV